MKSSLVPLSLIVALFSLALDAAEPAKPNVIIILADDLGYSDIGCYGGEIHTPNLDKLAAGGLRFTQFYNSAKCEPTRASLMSGQYWQDCGLHLKQGVTMGQAMKSAGYATFAIGKWHLAGNPFERGFDQAKCLANSAGPLGIVRLYLPKQDQPIEIDWIEIAPQTGAPKRTNF